MPNRDIPIGETFIQGQRIFLVKECKSHYCTDCYFIEKNCNWIEDLPHCFSENRKDCKYVVFKRIKN